jgi:hypothetical protein
VCDYSLANEKSRLAVVGEDLRFSLFGSGSVGLVSTTGPRDTAVCIPPGAKLQLSGIPEGICIQYGVKPVEEVVFTQRNMLVNTYRDAVIFNHGKANEKNVSIQAFGGGGFARVLSLEGATEREPVQEIAHHYILR